MKKFISILLLIILNTSSLSAYTQSYGPLTDDESFVLSFGSNKCKDFKQSDIPTIFIPGILASWYSEEGYNESKTKRWIPDPITHSYDTLFYTFKQNGYSIRDVFYKDQFETYIDGNPKQSLYLFGYDWKKDNKVTAKLLSNLILQIREKYEQENGCDIGTVNIIGHSMGGLVARAMLSDMCADESEYIAYYNSKQRANGQLKYFKNNDCDNFTRVNQFITIATPNRGAPKSFIIWEKGDLEKTEGFTKSVLLKGQLGVTFDLGLYEILHGFKESIPKGIVTIGQLLPDIGNTNKFNDKLLYLERDGKKMDKNIYPQNSFLEELNKKSSINNMFGNISGKYTMYYSDITGNEGDVNNIVGFDIPKEYNTGLYGITTPDHTNTYKGLDIYDKYYFSIKFGIYSIGKILKNYSGLGGDGTVPTNNLLLSTNDTDEIIKDNSKFKSEQIKCYDDTKGINTENGLVLKLGEVDKELCSHTKMPILTAIKVLDRITGNTILNSKEVAVNLKKEQELLYKYIGYLDYRDTKTTITKATTPVGKVPVSTYSTVGLMNDSNLDNKFEKNYKQLFSDSDIKNYLSNRNKDNYDRISLNFTGDLGQLDSLLRYEILSPINLIIEDEQGRKIGIDPETGKIVNEIPGAWTSGDTEGSNEPEFFLIPRTGTGKIMNKIHSYGTGDGEYHIVLNEIKTNPDTTSTGYTDETASFVIAGTAKKGVVENYLVDIDGNKANYKLTDTEVSTALKKVELSEKYHDILIKLYEILDKKYTKAKKQKLKKNLIKFKESKNPKYANNEKVNFLIDMIIEYIK
ncbi:MAG: hypothetical protein PHS49_02215 [Candidatus Gracilibacteria bacterium]|nr:hypothetical protein [Candidatus Gracilibacteria bacterium]